ncbi:MAG: hypothetical protein J6Z11_10220 [Candidatus Riflebacteria bacterium]|nr:hypothetical protein [Candidatus Riflebacteria bacterium]
MGKALAAKPNEIKSLQVKAQSADKEGYVEVETEFGRAYIVATKLHEDIQEAVKIDEVEQKYVDMFPQVVSNKELWEDETFDNFFKD